ncbi:hypothetical protein AVEN_267822-1 [Araneus ventricosus]|uniref:Uncharacterized protein n=1 Tax=Araneus ventricosus TaxID=182803 RepID=A0A4Y2D3I0_ARAVE|nr:hypothetical protein AVEN_267822-1 [Araneus ventricosus]
MCRPFRLLFCDQPIRLLPPDLQPPRSPDVFPSRAPPTTCKRRVATLAQRRGKELEVHITSRSVGLLDLETPGLQDAIFPTMKSSNHFSTNFNLPPDLDQDAKGADITNGYNKGTLRAHTTLKPRKNGGKRSNSIHYIPETMQFTNSLFF